MSHDAIAATVRLNYRMKQKVSILKLIKKIIFFIIITGFVLILGVYAWLNLRISSIVTDSEYKEIINEINKSKELTTEFYSQFEKVYGMNSTNDWFVISILKTIQGKSMNTECPCRLAAYRFHQGNGTANNTTLAFALENSVGKKKCLDFYIKNFDFLYNNIGIENAAKYYYKKNGADLTKDEILELVIMIKNPSYYNKIRHPERLKNAVRKYKNN